MKSREPSSFWEIHLKLNLRYQPISLIREIQYARWNVMFERLQKYKEERGDCWFPQKYEEDPQLGKLVSHQRSISTVDDKMEQEHLDKLNSI
jgi:hypothetical protein